MKPPGSNPSPYYSLIATDSGNAIQSHLQNPKLHPPTPAASLSTSVLSIRFLFCSGSPRVDVSACRSVYDSRCVGKAPKGMLIRFSALGAQGLRGLP